MADYYHSRHDLYSKDDRHSRQRRFRLWRSRIATWFLSPQTRIKSLCSVLFFMIIGTFYCLNKELAPPLPSGETPPSATQLVYSEQFPPKVMFNARPIQKSVKGPPAKKFRDNLHSNTSYITTWSNAGFTNQFINYVNMIYLGVLSDRVPIVPPFAPDHHISPSAGIIPFGDIFDLNHLREELKIPILEWRDVKKLPSRVSKRPYSTSEIEDLGCWTTRKESEGEPIRAENVVHHLGLDVSYTRVPTYSRFEPLNKEEPHVVFPQLAALIYPRNPLDSPDSFRTLASSPSGHWRRPEAHLSCFDTLYYASSGTKMFEWQYSWSPAWRAVGRHINFMPKIKNLGRQYLTKAFGIDPWEDIPPFIIVHIRRGDFAVFCNQQQSKLEEDCLPTLDDYEKQVNDVKKKLNDQQGFSISKVLVVSDETSPIFWMRVKARKWFFVDHIDARTSEKYGEWFPPIIDVVVQTYAIGFVGTKDSTFSLVGERRVHEWNGGIIAEVDVREGS